MHKSLVAAAVLAATAQAHAVSEPKVNVYWGQKGDTRLRDHCDQANFDYVTIGFVNNSPEQDKSGLNYPGINFGSHCDAIYYTNPLTNLASPLLSKCTVIASDIQYCQEKGKKVLLSVGGAAVTGSSYPLSSDAKGEEFASFLWGAFGPYDSKWTGPRPFDYAGNHVSVDGFDLDIEVNFSSVGQSAYVALAKKLRELYNGNSKYLLTAAPECPLDDANFKMKSIIANAQFDALFIQFYNNPGCAAASNSGFNYLQWEQAIATGKSKHAKLFIGLPGSSDAADSGYIEPVKAAALINTYKTRASFGGAMIWDVYHGQKVTDGKTFVDAINTACHGTAKPATAAPAPNAIGCTAYHTVTPGEYCYLIAQNYGITITELIRYNPTMNAACAVQSGQKLCVKQGIVTLASTITSAPAVSSTEAASSSSEAVSTAEFCEDETTTSAPAITSAPVVISSSAINSEIISSTTTEDDSCDVEIISEDPVGSATESVVVSSTEAPVVSATESAVVSETASVTEPSLISVSFSIEVPTTTDDACEDDTTPSEVPSATEGPSDGSSTAIDLSIITSAPVVIPSGGSSEIISSTTTEDDSCDVEIISEDPIGSATESVVVSSTEAPVVSATGSAVPSDPIDDEIITKDPVGSATGSVVVSSTEAPVVSATESAVPSDIVSESILPSGVVPSGVVPSGVVPSGIVSESIIPSGVVPSSVVPSGVVPSGVAPSGVVPSGVVPSGIVSSIISDVTSGPTDGSNVVVPSASVSVPIESGISSAPGAGVTSAPAEEWTTSTIYATTTSTITSCAPEVTDCPAKIGQVTTVVVAIGTTVCPVTATETSASAPTGIITSVPIESIPAGFTTSTIYATTTSTITSCAPTVTDCPGKIGQVTTIVVPVGVTVCPITEAFPPATSVPAAPSAGAPGAPGAPAVSAPAVPSGGAGVPVPSGSAPGAPGAPEVDTTSTISVTSVNFTTVTVAKPTASAPGAPGAGVPAASSPAAFPSEVPSGGAPAVPSGTAPAGTGVSLAPSSALAKPTASAPGAPGAGVPAESSPAAFPSEVPSGGAPVPSVVNAPAVPSGTAPAGTGVSLAPSSAPSTYSMPAPPAQTEPATGSEPSEVPVTAGAGRNVVAIGVPALMAALILAL
ncbi:hypothetical protein B0H65DRAFT_438104 [Neurospora tetraspora]|uniref:chitinase n=1 Tax=Neurospora tetraspora TaxID=94610 RepID=A0AAE0JPS1_9PEZI|nr:hypothetical protein B0H65DRAFT_438104 [Neurospora tetraspora]